MATDYGRDMWCRATLIPTRMVSGIDLLVNALSRRITTPRGRLYYHPNYGIDMTVFIGVELTPGAIARMEAELVSEIEADPRVIADSVRTVVREVKSSNRTDLEFEVSGTSQVGPFAFVTTVDRVTLELIGVRRTQ